LPAVLREGNRKYPRTPAFIGKFILEIPGISNMFWYITLQVFQMTAQNSKEKQKKLKKFSRPKKKPTKSGVTMPLRTYILNQSK